MGDGMHGRTGSLCTLFAEDFEMFFNIIMVMQA